MIPGVTGGDPFRAELAERQAVDMTETTRFYALENVAADGFPRVGGQTIGALVTEGLIARQPGRVPYTLTLAGVNALIAHREANQ